MSNVDYRKGNDKIQREIHGLVVRCNRKARVSRVRKEMLDESLPRVCLVGACASLIGSSPAALGAGSSFLSFYFSKIKKVECLEVR